MQLEQIYIGGLAPAVDENTLKELLSGISGVEGVEIIRDLITGKSMGYGVLQVPDSMFNETIERLNGKNIVGSVMDARLMPVTLPGEMPVREYLLTHALEVLSQAGIQPGQTVLDYGCGPGVYSVAAAQIVEQTGKVYAMDVRERALQRVREKADKAGMHNIETLLQHDDSIVIPFHNSSFDAVIIYDVWHDLKNKSGLLQEAHRILRPAGFLTAFPMHWGNEPFLELVQKSGFFRLRDVFIPPNSKSPSHILNFVRR